MPFPAIHPALDQALTARDYLEPTSVQSAVLEPETAGRDLLVSAQTGSGKTVAFGLAFAPTIMDDGALPPPGPPLALIVAPTRELAMQVQAELSWLYAGARIVGCVGGMDARREARELARGCHIVVGTPGRLGDHIRREQLNLARLRVVVLDEADEMLDLGFQEELQFILDATPDDRRTMLFSATIPHDIARLARQYQRDALRIDTIDRSQAHADIEYRAMRVAPHDIERAVVNVLRYFDPAAALVFCATREATRRLHIRLVERGFAAVALSGELSQHDRTTALDSLRAGRSRVCVCTDVAARGLDLPELNLVVHADLPTNPETLLHRSGRTGRAGRKGVSVLIVPNPKRRRAEQVLTAARVVASWGPPPSADEIRARDQERLLEDPIFTPPEGVELERARALLAGMSAEQVAAALLRLQAARLPPPEDIDAEAPAERRPVAHADALPPSTAFTQFRLSIGRRDKADPKWLIPLICRMGGVTKREIGAIRIFDGDTRFEIAQDAAARFAASVRQAPPGEAQITPAGDGPMPQADTRKRYVKRVNTGPDRKRRANAG
jgi:ATP-dependent RNA helicase DeaD